jgi:predicted house-cleaning noncanonical NTP pyrophosphatase (MazG superfamily)
MTIYNKLVRDRIPEIIEQAGKRCKIRSLSSEEYKQCLRAKLTEEVEEFLNSGELNELADILEVIYALAEASGLSWDELEQIRQMKAEERGRFHQQFFLESVD